MRLVLLSPIGLDSHCWDQFEAPEGASIVRHDLPGIGSRAGIPALPIMGELADDVAAIHEGDLHLVGASFGGMIAIHTALRHSSRVRSLLLVCTHASADPEVVEDRARQAEAVGMEGVLPSTIDRWFSEDALYLRPEHPGITYARKTLLECDPGVFAGYWRAMATHQVLGELHTISANVTCLAGMDDASVSMERVNDMASRIPNSRLSQRQGPHMIHLERPDVFRDELARHVEWVSLDAETS